MKKKHGTAIEWTHARSYTGETWNPLRARHRTTGQEGWHCVHVSEGCRHCYAETLNVTQRWNRGTGLPYAQQSTKHVETYLDEKTLTQPLRWTKPRMVFVCSMTDLFGEWVTDEMLDRIFAVMALADRHLFLVLTKRPERMAEYLNRTHGPLNQTPVARIARAAQVIAEGRGEDTASPWDVWLPLSHIWLGTSVEDQATANARIPYLLRCPARLRWLSCEPLLETVDLRHIPSINVHSEGHSMNVLRRPSVFAPKIDWVIVGGESGAKARPFDLTWAADLVADCQEAGVPVFMKQLGSNPVLGKIPFQARGKGGDPSEWPPALRVREYPSMP